MDDRSALGLRSRVVTARVASPGQRHRAMVANDPIKRALPRARTTAIKCRHAPVKKHEAARRRPQSRIGFPRNYAASETLLLGRR